MKDKTRLIIACIIGVIAIVLFIVGMIVLP